jgi:hypothetical protein
MVCPGCGAPDDQGCYKNCSEIMQKKNTDRTAFPDINEQGMTLRDWFAGQALANSILTKSVPGRWNEHTVARDAYRIADAMLIERAQ